MFKNATLAAKISRIVSELGSTHTLREEQYGKHSHSHRGKMCSLSWTHSGRWVRSRPTALPAVNIVPMTTCYFHTEILCFSLKDSVGSWYCSDACTSGAEAQGGCETRSRSGLTPQGAAPLSAWLLTPLSGSSLRAHPCRPNCDSSSQTCWRLCLCINKPKCIWK